MTASAKGEVYPFPGPGGGSLWTAQKVTLEEGSNTENEKGDETMIDENWMLIGLLALVFGALAAIAALSNRGSLNSIKNKTVGDGQYGTARWATEKEIRKSYRRVPFRPALWRKGEQLPEAQGLVLGCVGKKDRLAALVDCDDIHCLMIGASGVGKTAYFLYPNMEYACASGMSFLALDTKGGATRS
jgi:hypothetical protein